jgi:hypothetical protein
MMASGTSTTTPPPAPMRRTPGIGPDAAGPYNMNRGSIMPPGSTAGVGTVPLAGIGMLPGTENGMTEIKPLGPLRPVLIDGFDRSLLGKLYPDADDPAAAAMAAAEERIRMGLIAEESLTQPYYTEDGVQAPGNPDFSDPAARGTGTHRARPGENDPPVPQRGVNPPPQQDTSATPPRGEQASVTMPPRTTVTHDDDKDDDKKNDKKNDKK